MLVCSVSRLGAIALPQLTSKPPSLQTPRNWIYQKYFLPTHWVLNLSLTFKVLHQSWTKPATSYSLWFFYTNSVLKRRRCDIFLQWAIKNGQLIRVASSLIHQRVRQYFSDLSLVLEYQTITPKCWIFAPHTPQGFLIHESKALDLFGLVNLFTQKDDFR